MTIEAELHDGRILEFPEGTNPTVIQATVKKMLGGSHMKDGQYSDIQARPAAPAKPKFTGQERTLPVGEIASRFGSGALNAGIAGAQAPIIGALTIADALASRVGGLFGNKPKSMADLYADRFVQPAMNAVEAASLKPGEDAGAIGTPMIQAAPGLGRMVGDLAVGGPLGGAAKGLMGPTTAGAANSVAQAVMNTLREGAVTGLPTAFRSAGERQNELQAAGASPLESVIPAAVTGMGTAGQFALPMGTGSSLPTVLGRGASRAAQSVALNVPAGIVQRQAENAVLPDSAAQLRADPLSAEAVTGDTLAAAVLSMMGARNRPTATRSRADMGYDAPTPELPALPAPEPRLALPAPETTGTIRVDSEGNARPELAQDAAITEIVSRLTGARKPEPPPALPDNSRVIEGEWRQVGDALPAPEKASPVAPIRVDAEGVARPETYGEGAARTEAQAKADDVARYQREELGNTSPDALDPRKPDYQPRQEDANAAMDQSRNQNGDMPRPEAPDSLRRAAGMDGSRGDGDGGTRRNDAPADAVLRSQGVGNAARTTDTQQLAARPDNNAGANGRPGSDGAGNRPNDGPADGKRGTPANDAGARAAPESAARSADAARAADNVRAEGVDPKAEKRAANGFLKSLWESASRNGRGGIKPSIMREAFGNRAGDVRKRFPMLANNKGHGTDDLVAWAVKGDWLSDADVARLDATKPGGAYEYVLNMIRDAEAGKAPRKPDVVADQRNFEAEKAAFERDETMRYAKDLGIKNPEAMSDMELYREIAEREIDQANDILRAGDNEPDTRPMSEQMRDFGFTEDEIKAQWEREGNNNGKPEAAGDGGGAAAEGKGGGGEARVQDAPGARNQDEKRPDAGPADKPDDGGQRPGFELAGENRADTEQRIKRESGAKREAELAAKKADEKSAADKEVDRFELSGSDRAADAPGQGDLAGNSPKPDVDPAAYRLNALPLDAVWRTAKKVMGDGKQWEDYVSWLADATKALARGGAAAMQAPKAALGKVKDAMTIKSGENAAAALVRYLNEDVGRRARVIVDNFDSPTARKVLGMMDFELGKGEGTGRVFREAQQRRMGAALNDLSPTLEAVAAIGESFRKVAGEGPLSKAKHHEAAWAAVIERIENPKLARQGEIGRAVVAVEKWLKAQRDMQIEAGVELGDVGSTYFPAKYLNDKVIADRAKFEQDAAWAYRNEDSSLSQKDAEGMAKALADGLVRGESFSLVGVETGASGSATKERVFAKTDSLNRMRKWRNLDGRDVLMSYADGAARRASIAERFGDNFGGKREMVMRDGKKVAEGKIITPSWKQLVDKITEEGGAGALPALRELVEIGTGVNQPRGFGSAFADGARSAMTMSALEKSVLPNLMEIITPLATTNGNLRAGLASLRTNIHGALGGLGFVPKSERRAAAKSLLEGIGALSEIASQQQSMARYSGADAGKGMLSAATGKFFEGIGLNKLTDAQRVSTADVAAVWFDSMAKSINGEAGWQSMFKGADAKHLRDFGIPAGKEKAFADFVQKLDGKIPTSADLAKAGEMGALYGDAITRFMNSTVQHGDALTRPVWANTPWGSLVFQFSSYTYAFHKNVIRRAYNNAMDAGNLKNDLAAADRLSLATGMVPGFMLMGAASYLVMEARDEVFNKLAGTKKNLTQRAKEERAIQNANLMGKYGRVFEQFGQQKYGTGAAGLFVPPAVAQGAKGLDALSRAANEGSDKNAGKRAMWKWTYNTVMEPAWQIALSAGPGIPFGAASVAARTFAPSAGEGAFVDTVAGKKQRENKQQIRGITEGPKKPGAMTDYTK